jgi:hypothetical protein
MKRRDVVGALGASVVLGIARAATAPPEAPHGSQGEIVTYRTATDLMRQKATSDKRVLRHDAGSSLV